jgi:F0F1-type ATP synthase assembly protein I
MASQEPSSDRHRGVATDYARYAGLGLQFALTLIAFALAGWWLDAKLGSSPWLLLLGVLLGATGGFVALVRAVPPARGGARPPAPPPPPPE